MKPFILKLPDDLHKRIKRQAFDSEISMQQFIIAILEKGTKVK